MLTQQQVGRFEIRDFLGRGAIGDVYLAWDPHRQGEVALKLIRTLKTDPEMLEAEKNGLALQKQLAEAAPQVAAVYEEGQDNGFFWVALEYVPGVDLSEILDLGPLPEERAVAIALQLCEMLEACHRFSTEVGGRRIFGIVHGDIKPENIRLQEGDRVRVLDFGIAKHLSQTRKFTVNLFGSLPYTPPERLEMGRVDFRSDLWAVGVILYMMVSGETPFAAQDPEELETRIRRGEPPAPLPKTVSPVLQKIVRRSLAFDVARRYQTASEIRADLEAFHDGRPLPSEGAPASPAGDDLNATRRTSRPLEDPDRTAVMDTSQTRRTVANGGVNGAATAAGWRELGSTRRTVEPEAAPPPPPPPPPASPESVAPDPLVVLPPEPPRRRSRIGFVFLILLPLVLLGAVLGSQFWVRGEAREIQRALVSDPDPDLDAVLARYENAARFALPMSGLGEVKEELRTMLTASADRILDAYRGDSPKTTERGWQKAHHYLEAALDLDYDKETRARMLYAKAHLDRIEAQSLRAKGQRDEARNKIDDAVAGFRDAARRDPAWPDPYLGLARVYAYESFDLDALQKALGELGRRGYPLGRREKAMLADGFRMKGLEFHSRAQKTREVDDEVMLLERARDHYIQAINFYDEIPSYADARKNRAETERQLATVERRLDAIHQPGVFEELLGVLGREVQQEVQRKIEEETEETPPPF
ncbi:MAG TPA: protein kinase [Thermoanaerobaculia bacterium]